MKEKLLSTVLPPAVREQLQAAARLDPGSPPGESFTRTRELNGVITRAKLHYPQYFKQETFPTTRGDDA